MMNDNLNGVEKGTNFGLTMIQTQKVREKIGQLLRHESGIEPVSCLLIFP